MLKRLTVSVFFTVLVMGKLNGLVCSAEDTQRSESPADMRRARQEAVRQPRRIVFNDDGGAIITGDTPESFIGVRLAQILDTQVDTVFHNTGQTTVFQHDTKVAETIDGAIDIYGANEHGRRQARHIRRLREEFGTDSIELSLAFCRQHDIEYFWSLRMNDIHDALPGEIWRLGRWKHENPEYILGNLADWDRYPAHDPRKWWTSMDFATAEVRDYLFRIIQEVCQRYDVDGIELDWWRSPLFFRSTQQMKPVEDKHIKMMNRFVRRIRNMTERVAQKRGRPLLVAARVPMSVKRGRSIGLDVETWLKEDLVDMLTAGCGYAPRAMAPSIREMVTFARPYGVPVFACISASGIRGDSSTERPDDRIVELWRGAAMNIWQAGAAGVYTFNYCPQYRDERFSQMGSTDTLKGLDKIYAIDNIVEPTFEGDLRPGLVVPDRLPLKLIEGSIIAKLPVGEDITAGTPAGKTCHARLHLQLDDVAQGDKFDIKLNGRSLKMASHEEERSNGSTLLIEFEPEPGLVQEGNNLVELRRLAQRAADKPVVLNLLELEVSYE